MATVYAPDNACGTTVDDDSCAGDFCPRELAGCKNGCYEIKACTNLRIAVPLGCNPFTLNDLQTSDLTEIEFRGTYDADGTVVAFVWTLTANAALFVANGLYQYDVVLPPEQTADLPSGALNAEIIFTTADGTWTAYDFCLKVEREFLASPSVIITGDTGAPSTFTIVAGLVTLWLHESDEVHVDRTWDRFVTDWGDGTETTLDVSALQPPTAAAWTTNHTYLASGTYTISVTGYLSYDDADACDTELSDCATFIVCVTV